MLYSCTVVLEGHTHVTIIPMSYQSPSFNFEWSRMSSAEFVPPMNGAFCATAVAPRPPASGAEGRTGDPVDQFHDRVLWRSQVEVIDLPGVRHVSFISIRTEVERRVGHGDLALRRGGNNRERIARRRNVGSRCGKGHLVRRQHERPTSGYGAASGQLLQRCSSVHCFSPAHRSETVDA
jgi:hypothetical protein